MKLPTESSTFSSSFLFSLLLFCSPLAIPLCLHPLVDTFAFFQSTSNEFSCKNYSWIPAYMTLRNSIKIAEIYLLLSKRETWDALVLTCHIPGPECISCCAVLGFLGDASVKQSAWYLYKRNGFNPGSGRAYEVGMPNPFSILAWEPMDRGFGSSQSMELTQLSD